MRTQTQYFTQQRIDSRPSRAQVPNSQPGSNICKSVANVNMPSKAGGSVVTASACSANLRLI